MKRANLCIFVPPWKSVPDRCLLRWHVEFGVALCILVFSYRMMNKLQNANRVMVRLFRFLLLVLRDFKRNQGLLLSGAVAYYTLLSIVPLLILAFIGLTHFIEEQQLIHTLSRYLEMVIPGYAATLTEQVRAFLEHRKAVGIIGFLTMLFFGSLAFSTLENAMSVIFFQRVIIQRRNFLVSAIIPYVYIFVMGLAIVLVSLLVGAIETLESSQLRILGWSWNLGGPVHPGDRLRGDDIHLHLSGDARGAGKISARAHRRDHRSGFMGNHPPGAVLVLRGRIHGECHLRFHRHNGGGPPQHRGRCGHPAAWWTGHCGS
jgi:hypothetical protein